MSRKIMELLIIVLLLCLIASHVGAIKQPEIVRTKETADLDGDGKEETVHFAAYGIRENSYKNTFILKIFGNIAAFNGDALEGYFKILDIDTTDRYLEIAVPE